MLLALIIRLPYVPTLGSRTDFSIINGWGSAVYYDNLSFYRATESNYPPVYPVIVGLTQGASEIPVVKTLLAGSGFSDVVRLKLPSLAAELALIALAADWLRHQRRLRWTIPLLLALHPGLIIVSSLWTQNDALYTLFLVAALLLLRRGRLNAAWVIYAIALLTKLQSVVLLPLLLILTYRRFPLRQAARAVGAAGLVIGATLFVFGIASGFDLVIRPYVGATVDLFPLTTVNAYNLWTVVEPGFWSGEFWSFGPSDALPSWLAPLTYREVGFLLLGVYVLLVCWSMWRRAQEDREFVWAAALYVGFFILPTQMHERYFYPGVIMVILAIAQDRRFLVAALLTIWTFTFNLIAALDAPFWWVGMSLRWYIGSSPPRLGAINLFLLLDVALLAIPRATPRWLLYGERIALGGCILFVLALRPPTFPLPDDARLVNGVMVGQGVQLIGYALSGADHADTLTLYWRAAQPIYGSYIARIDAEHDETVVASVTGSYFDSVVGTWRWTRGSVYWTEYTLDYGDQPAPNRLYLSVFEESSKEALPIFQTGEPIAGDRLLLAMIP